MARLARAEVFAPEEIAIVHVMNRVVRRCFLLGDDSVTGKNYDHRKVWIEEELKHLAANFGIDLLVFAILSNHFHLVLRSRPDVVATWDDTEVARRWLRLCPLRPGADQPTEFELNSIRHDEDKLIDIRRRLSDISWWMRLLCQKIAQRANSEDEEVGKFWQSRFRAVRLLDEESLLACAAYVDLNPIRAAMAETLEESDYTSAQRRMQALRAQVQENQAIEAGPSTTVSDPKMHDPLKPGLVRKLLDRAPDGFLSPLELDERQSPLGACASTSGSRSSDKGFLPMSAAQYLELLDWTARRIVSDRRGLTPEAAPAIFDRLSIKPEVWCEMVKQFGKLFSVVAGKPQLVDETRSRIAHRRHHLSKSARELLAS